MSLFDLHGKVALITGATSGIGSRQALALARAGASVILLGRREERLRGLCLFLASHASDYVTGQVIYIDGGFTAK